MSRSVRLASIMLVVLLAGGCVGGTSTPVPSASVGPTPTSTPSPEPTSTTEPSVTPTTALPALVGEWERHGKQDGRAYTEHFILSPDGTYSIAARFDDTGEELASTSGTYKATATTLTLTDKDGQSTSTPYYIDAAGRLVIDNKTDLAWTRVQ